MNKTLDKQYKQKIMSHFPLNYIRCLITPQIGLPRQLKYALLNIVCNYGSPIIIRYQSEIFQNKNIGYKYHF